MVPRRSSPSHPFAPARPAKIEQSPPARAAETVDRRSVRDGESQDRERRNDDRARAKSRQGERDRHERGRREQYQGGHTGARCRTSSARVDAQTTAAGPTIRRVRCRRGGRSDRHSRGTARLPSSPQPRASRQSDDAAVEGVRTPPSATNGPTMDRERPAAAAANAIRGRAPAARASPCTSPYTIRSRTDAPSHSARASASQRAAAPGRASTARCPRSGSR